MSTVLAASDGVNALIGIGIWLVVAAASVGLWLLPVFIAVRRHVPNVNQIVAVDLLAAWFFGVGWIIALVWALKPLPPPYPPPYAQPANYRQL